MTKNIELTLTLAPKAVEIIDKLLPASGYPNNDALVQEMVFAIQELLDLATDNKTLAVTGILSTFTRFAEETA